MPHPLQRNKDKGVDVRTGYSLKYRSSQRNGAVFSGGGGGGDRRTREGIKKEGRSVVDVVWLSDHW